MSQATHTYGSSLQPTPEMATDIVRATQHIYRRLVDAMSHPGETFQLIPHPHMEMEQDQNPTWIASVLMTLVDHEVRVHLLPSPDAEALADVITRRVRAPHVSIEEADFVAAHMDHFDPDVISAMKVGSLDYPDDGATLVIQMESLTTADGPGVVLTGPGIKDQRTRPLGEMTTGFIAARNEATHDYPLGVDVILVDRTGLVMALPRTTVIAVRDGEN